MEDNIDILERIHNAYYQLTTAERKVADYVLSNHSQVQFMSITQLAEECGTGEATISRFCRSLKLKGFNAFKIQLAQHGQTQTTAPTPDPGMDSRMARSMEICRTATDSIMQTIELIQPDAIDKAVTLLERAPHVWCIGSGGSMIMANECSHMFSTVSGKFFPISDSHLQMSAVAIADPQDVFILFSYSGATSNGMQVLELAKSRNIPTILVTRYSKSPAANLATVVLRCGSNESPFQFGSIAARIAQLIVVDVLFQEFCHRNRETCERNIQAIADALSNLHI